MYCINLWYEYDFRESRAAPLKITSYIHSTSFSVWLVVGVHHTSLVVRAHFELILQDSSWIQSYNAHFCEWSAHTRKCWHETFLCSQFSGCHIIIFSNFFIVQNNVWMLLPIHSWQVQRFYPFAASLFMFSRLRQNKCECAYWNQPSKKVKQ